MASTYTPLSSAAPKMAGSCWWKSRMALPRWVAERTPAATQAMAASYPAPLWPMAQTIPSSPVRRGMSAAAPGISGDRVTYFTWPPAARWYSAKRLKSASCISRCSGMAPLYCTDRQGPSRWMPSRAAPP